MKSLVSWKSDRRGRRPSRKPTGLRPSLDALEDRLVLTGNTNAAFFNALTTRRYWVDYAPSNNSSSDPYNANPTDQQIDSDMKALYSEGFRGLVTYTLLGTYADIPRIAKADGFQYVIAGIYYPDNSTEIAAASSSGVLPYTDAFVVGNEGLQARRYSISQLTTAIAEVQQATGKPVSTSEAGGQYYAGSANSQALLSMGDWLFPNIDYFQFPGPSTPQQMWTNVSFVYSYMLQNNKTPGPVVAKEAFYPTAGADAVASPQNQITWYGSEAVPGKVNGQPFYFVWGEAFDQPWKIQIDSYEPHMGLNSINNSNGSAAPKPIISQLAADISGTYGTTRTAMTLSTTKPRTRAGQVQLTAKVGSAGKGLLPKGTVRFFDGDRYLGTAKVIDGAARLRTTVPAGLNQLEAVFQGTGNFLRSEGSISRQFAK